jgi:hypothetical protein
MPTASSGFIAAIVKDAALPKVEIQVTEKKPRTLPGFYRPCKEWDLVVLSGDTLVAVVEVKSQVRSFGNNFNNRVEEALGNATDFWAAYREGIFSPSQKPWLGYLFMLEEHQSSIRATKPITLKPYQVDEAFQKRSYAKRYELVCERLLRDRLYDAACFFTSNARTGKRGEYQEPNQELSIKNFAISCTPELRRSHGWATRSRYSKQALKSESRGLTLGSEQAKLLLARGLFCQGTVFLRATFSLSKWSP